MELSMHEKVHPLLAVSFRVEVVALYERVHWVRKKHPESVRRVVFSVCCVFTRKEHSLDYCSSVVTWANIPGCAKRNASSLLASCPLACESIILPWYGDWQTPQYWISYKIICWGGRGDGWIRWGTWTCQTNLHAKTMKNSTTMIELLPVEGWHNFTTSNRHLLHH